MFGKNTDGGQRGLSGRTSGPLHLEEGAGTVSEGQESKDA